MTVNGGRRSPARSSRRCCSSTSSATRSGLTGTHWGCDTSNCGACVVQMDGRPVKSCTVLAAMAEGHEIRTIEALEVGRRARPGSAGLPRGARPAMRVLHAGNDHDRPRPARRQPGPHRGGDPRRRSRARSAAAPGTRTSSEQSAGRLSTRPPNPKELRMATTATQGNADRLRQDEAQGGRALHPRPGQVPRRHRPARDAPRRRAAQPVCAREDRLDRHLGGACPPEGATG